MREQLANALDWGEAHADFDKAVDGLPADLRGRRVQGLPHSAWEIELTDRIPHGSGQTYLREVLLVLDHNAYHVAELVVLRRLLGAWSK
jgi:hypothetical protein